MTSSVFPDLYTKGSRIWTPDTGQVWKLAFIKENYVPENKILIVTDEDHQVCYSFFFCYNFFLLSLHFSFLVLPVF